MNQDDWTRVGYHADVLDTEAFLSLPEDMTHKRLLPPRHQQDVVDFSRADTWLPALGAMVVVAVSAVMMRAHVDYQLLAVVSVLMTLISVVLYTRVYYSPTALDCRMLLQVYAGWIFYGVLMLHHDHDHDLRLYVDHHTHRHGGGGIRVFSWHHGIMPALLLSGFAVASFFRRCNESWNFLRAGLLALLLVLLYPNEAIVPSDMPWAVFALHVVLYTAVAFLNECTMTRLINRVIVTHHSHAGDQLRLPPEIQAKHDALRVIRTAWLLFTWLYTTPLVLLFVFWRLWREWGILELPATVLPVTAPRCPPTPAPVPAPAPAHPRPSPPPPRLPPITPSPAPAPAPGPAPSAKPEQPDVFALILAHERRRQQLNGKSGKTKGRRRDPTT